MPRTRRSRSIAFAIAAVPAAAAAEQITVEQFTPGLGDLVAIAVDEAADRVYLYPAFGDIHVLALDLTPITSYEQPSVNSNDIDMDVLHTSTTLAGVEVPAGSLLVFNGESDPQRVWALEPLTGKTIAMLELAEPIGQLVGGAVSPDGADMYLVDWSSDVVRSFDMQTGEQLDSFPVQPEDSPGYDVFYGDMDVAANGNILIASSNQTRIREMTPGGQFVQDVDIASFGISQIAGIDTLPASRVVYAATLGESFWRVDGVTVLTPACAADLNADGAVDAIDLNQLLASFGAGAAGDVNCDGVTDASDLNTMLGAFGEACEFPFPE